MVRTGVWFFPDAPSGSIVEAIVAAEQLGLDEVWLGDEGPARDPFALLAAAAHVTRRIRLGIGVTNPYLRHPTVTAASALTVHELSGGRMLLGIGPGGQIALGPPHVARSRPLSTTREAVRLMRAVARGECVPGFTPPPHAITGPDLPIYVGARGERFNRMASELADGVFFGGVPRSRLDATLAWAHSVRPIEVAVYPSATFDAETLELARPRVVYGLLDAPEITRIALGVERTRAAAAAEALSRGDPAPARAVIDDRLLDELILHGSPEHVGRALAARTRSLRPSSIGFALLTSDPRATLEPAATALAIAQRELA
jgi:5,10-methylenetetrahydromethanopterin reductase